MTHIYEYERVGVCACTASRKTDEYNCSVDSVVWAKRVARRVQMCIDEDLVNHILNKSEAILISIVSVI